MKPTKMYRIELKSMMDIAKEAAVLAALSNGNKHIDLKSIAAGAELECLKYPVRNEGVTISLIGDNDLTIDNGKENLLHLKQIEVMELDVPTLSAYEAKDLMNEINNQ